MPCFFHAMGRVCHAVMQVVHHFPTPPDTPPHPPHSDFPRGVSTPHCYSSLHPPEPHVHHGRMGGAQGRGAEEGGGTVESLLAATRCPVCGPVSGVVEDLGDELGGQTEAGGEKPAG